MRKTSCKKKKEKRKTTSKKKKAKRHRKSRRSSSKKRARRKTPEWDSNKADKENLKPLPLPWPWKNRGIMRKPGVKAVKRCWTFLDTMQYDGKLIFDSDVHVTIESLRRLKPGMMLNDEIVNASYKYLGEKVKRLGRKIKIFNSFFFTTLHGHGNYTSSNYNFHATRRWTKPSRLPGKCQNVFDLDMMAFPIFLKVRRHWLCGIIVNKDRCAPKFLLFNSDFAHRGYETEHRRIISSMKRWWRDERTTRIGGTGPSLKGIVVSNIPQQGINSNDCGPISYAYATLACLVSPEVSQWPKFLEGTWLRDMMLCSILRKSEKFRNYSSSENVWFLVALPKLRICIKLNCYIFR